MVSVNLDLATLKTRVAIYAGVMKSLSGLPRDLSASVLRGLINLERYHHVVTISESGSSNIKTHTEIYYVGFLARYTKIYTKENFPLPGIRHAITKTIRYGFARMHALDHKTASDYVQLCNMQPTTPIIILTTILHAMHEFTEVRGRYLEQHSI